MIFSGKQHNIPKISAKEKRLHQEKYKKYLIHDFACPTWFIPRRVHPILVTNWMRFLFKQAKRMVLTSIEEGGHDNSDVSAAECLHDLYHLHEYKGDILSELDRILYHASEIHEIGHGCDYDEMINQNLDDIIDFSKNIRVDILCDEEKIISLPTTKRIEDGNRLHIVNVEHGFCSCKERTCQHITRAIEIGGSKGEVYYLNIDNKTCTCPGFTYTGNCKHVNSYL